MRSIWKGSLAFGLVNVPVKVYAATEEKDIRFHQVHATDGGRIRYHRVCEKCGKKVEFAEIDKAYESDDGKTVIITDEDLQSLPIASGNEIEVNSFVPEDQIDPMYFDKSYYLEPNSKSPKAYVLLRDTLLNTERIAMVNFALRQKTKLAVLRVRDDVLVVQTLLWPDEVRSVHFSSLDEDVTIKDAELKMASTLVESYADDFRPEDYQDDYRVQLQQLIDAKLEGEEAFPTVEEEDEGEDAEVVDLLAALRRSVERHGSKSDGDAKADGGTRASSRRAKSSDDGGSGKADEGADADAKPARRTPSRSRTATKATEPKPAAAKTSTRAKSTRTTKSDDDEAKTPARKRSAS